MFQEQGITIASILTAIGMAIGVLVEALHFGGGGAEGGNPPPKYEAGARELIRNKLKALESLLGRLGVKAAKACLVSLEQLSVGSSIELQQLLVSFYPTLSNQQRKHL